ncbi:hypothetical protein ABW21_db0203984 [Orbilia brochopaga]|nr:hypothetical protein ABW21_db0203984 [Drechslerella brochopaga]
MDRNRSSAYEPLRHKSVGGDDEKPLVPPSSVDHHAALPRSANGRRGKNGGGGIHHFRTALRVLVLGIAVTILALQVNAVTLWRDTRDDIEEAKNGQQYRMQAWAVMDFTPTWVVVGVAGGSILIQSIALISLCLWLNKIRDGFLHVISVYLTSIVFIAAWIGALIYFRIDYSQGESKSRWDMWAYTCQNKAKTGGNIPWNALCIQMVSQSPIYIVRSLIKYKLTIHKIN